VPHFQVMLGGQWDKNAGSYALALGAIPSKRVPELVNTLTDRFVRERAGARDFPGVVPARREEGAEVDRRSVRREDAPRPAHGATRVLHRLGRPAAVHHDVATGECAGEVVSCADFGFTAAETEAFEAQLLLDDGKFQEADNRAYEAMLRPRTRWSRWSGTDAPAEPKYVVDEFRKRFVDTQIFWHRQHANQFSNYLVTATRTARTRASRATPRRSWSRRPTSSSTPPTRRTRRGSRS
jgi:sulfite reductase (ferredoxin)